MSAPIFAALSFIWSLARTQIGSIFIASALFYGLGYIKERGNCNARVADIFSELNRQVASERARRDAAIEIARNSALADVARLTSEKNDLEAKLKESANASHANDSRPCLDARSVRRLNRL